MIRPSRSSIEPREASLRAVFVPGLILPTPFISAAMDYVTGADMAIALYHAGGLGIVHRNCTISEQIRMVQRAKKAHARLGAAVGPFDGERARALAKAGIDMLVIDCAHGHNSHVIKSAKAVRKSIGDIPLVVGNIATAEAAVDLAGIADIVKVGVGPGSICITRIVSGVGVPQLSAIGEVARAAHRMAMRVIADGGMRTSGDIAKALAAGADAVMLGNILAGAKESPGPLVIQNGKKYKKYRGMGSWSVLTARKSSDRYLIDGRKMLPEGVEGLVPYRGPVKNVIAGLASGVQVAMGYVGAKNISEFHKRSRFIRITPASMHESNHHTLLAMSDNEAPRA